MKARKPHDTKTLITVMVISTLCIVVVLTLVDAIVNKTVDLFNIAFTVFASVVSSVTTYFFTRKTMDNIVKPDDPDKSS